MKIGIVKEHSLAGSDRRAILLPEEVKKLIRAGNKIFIDKGLGEGIFIDDLQYKKAGAVIVSEPKNVFSRQLVIKLRTPTDNEFLMMKNNILLSMLHIEQNYHRVEIIAEQKIKVIAMENIHNRYDERLINCTGMTGEQAMLSGFNLALKSPGECSILILGYGRVSSGAINVASKLGARVKILRKSEYKNIRYHLKGKDILVNGIAWPKYHRDKKDYVVTRKMLKLFNHGAVIVDISVDFPNPIETCKPTYPNDPWYEIDGVKHICINGYPSLVPISSSKKYSKQLLPLILDITKNGIKKMSKTLQRALFKPKDYLK
jgi:alanine dehydrogenase